MLPIVLFALAGPVTVRLGAVNVEVSPNFRMYMVTRLAIPSYLPEASTMVNLVDFTITRQVTLLPLGGYLVLLGVC